MAKWLSKLRSFVERKSQGVATDLIVAPGESRPRAAESTRIENEPAPTGRNWIDLWLEGIFNYLPFAMLIIGALIAACTELVGVWAIFGYLLVAVAPVAYWLRRIERLLAQIARMNRDH